MGAPPTAKSHAIAAQRKGLYGKIAVARKSLGIDEDAYRDLMETRYGVRSAKKLSVPQLEDFIQYFRDQGFKPKKGPPKRAGARRPVTGNEADKARALWISLYHLGVIGDASEAALGRYITRQTGLSAPEWVTDWRPVIEGMKAWAERAAGVTWEPYPVFGGPSIDQPRARVVEAQWRLLHEMGAVVADWRIGPPHYARTILNLPGVVPLFSIKDKDLDWLIVHLGNWIRAERGDVDG